jgi:uncharacterized membrane protein
METVNLVSTGIILLIVITIAYGGTFLVKVASGGVPANDLQKNFFRAGHAHAAVLVMLGLVIRLCLQHPAVPAWSTVLADFVLYAAVLMSAGFFLSAIGRDPKRPNRWIALLWVGAASLTIGLAGAGVGLIVARVST